MVERRTIADPKWVSPFLGKKVGRTFPMLSSPALKSGETNSSLSFRAVCQLDV